MTCRFVTCTDHIHHTMTLGVLPKRKVITFVCDGKDEETAVLGNLRLMKKITDIRISHSRIVVDREHTQLEVVTNADGNGYYFEKDFMEVNLRRKLI